MNVISSLVECYRLMQKKMSPCLNFLPQLLAGKLTSQSTANQPKQKIYKLISLNLDPFFSRPCRLFRIRTWITKIQET